MALLIFLTASTRAGFVASGVGKCLPLFLVLVSHFFHDIRRRAIEAQFIGHEAHRPVDVMEELLESVAEII